MVNVVRLNAYRPFLGSRATFRLAANAVEIQKVENRWERKATATVGRATQRVLDSWAEGRAGPTDAIDPLLTLLLEHMLDIMDRGLDVAEDAVDDLDDRAPTKRLAKKPPRVKIPRKMDDLRRFWDKVRHKRGAKKDGELTDRAREIFERTKKAYITKVQSIWEKYGADWRAGKTGSKEAAFQALQKATKSTASRVRTIIETETTYYYNATREAYYSQSDTVSHYLFLAVRDHATTKWCKSRHGKVFEKGTVLFRENIPPCHWSCRSEIVPLTAFNPRHKLLIDDKSKRATRANIIPLPPGWGRRSA